MCFLMLLVLVGLKIDESDTKFMVWLEGIFYVFGEFCGKWDIKREIQRRFMTGNRCLCAFSRVLTSKDAPKGLKWFCKIIRAVVIFGSRVWDLGG